MALAVFFDFFHFFFFFETEVGSESASFMKIVSNFVSFVKRHKALFFNVCEVHSFEGIKNIVTSVLFIHFLFEQFVNKKRKKTYKEMSLNALFGPDIHWSGFKVSFKISEASFNLPSYFANTDDSFRIVIKKVGA